MRTLLGLGIAAALWLVLCASGTGQQRREGDLQVGSPAADFTVKDVEGKSTVQLSKLKGKPVVLIFGSCT